jgi:hypothetical protein
MASRPTTEDLRAALLAECARAYSSARDSSRGVRAGILAAEQAIRNQAGDADPRQFLDALLAKFAVEREKYDVPGDDEGAALGGLATIRIAAERMRGDLTPRGRRGRARIALAIAVAADAVQMGLFPLFGEGFASPLDVALDVAVGGILVWLVGFHWAFLPGFGAELIPGLDLAPTWTAAVLAATGRSSSGRWRWLRWLIVAVLVIAGVAIALWLRRSRQ